MPSVAGVAQSVEQHIRNVWVGGSIPPIGLIKSIGYKIIKTVFMFLPQFSPIPKNHHNKPQLLPLKWRVESPCFSQKQIG